MGIQAAFKPRDGAGGPAQGPENKTHGELDARTIREDPVRGFRMTAPLRRLLCVQRAESHRRCCGRCSEQEMQGFWRGIRALVHPWGRIHLLTPHLLGGPKIRQTLVALRDFTGLSVAAGRGALQPASSPGGGRATRICRADLPPGCLQETRS